MDLPLPLPMEPMLANLPELFSSEEGLTQAGSRRRAVACSQVARMASLSMSPPLLKLFLDQVPTASLAGVVAVPLMVGGAPHHALAVEVHLRPLLVELGASVLTPGLYVLESDLPEIDAVVAAWWAKAGTALSNALGRSALTKLL